MIAAAAVRFVIVAGLIWAPATAAADDADATWTVSSTTVTDLVLGIAPPWQGRVWFATRHGLQRWDGLQLTSVSASAKGFTHSEVVAALAASSGETFAAVGAGFFHCEDRAASCTPAFPGNSGLLRVDANGAVATWHTLRGAKDDSVTALLEAQGFLWAGTPSGLMRAPLPVKRSNEPPTFEVVPPPPEWSSAGAVLCLARAPNDDVIVGTDRGAWRAHAGAPATTWANGPVTAVAAGEDGRIWMGTPAGLLVGAAGASRFVAGLERRYIRALEVSAGNVWVGTSAGLFRVVGSGRVLAVSGSGVDGAEISALRADGDGGVWIGLRAGPLLHAAIAPVANLGTLDGFATDAVASVVRRRDGAMLVVGRQGVAFELDPRTRAERARWPVPHQLVGSELGGAAAAPDGSVWFTARGAGIWRLAGGELRRVLSDDARLLSFSPDGVLWVADAAAGVRRYAVAGDGATSLPVVARPERCQGAIAGFAHRAGRDGVETWLATAHGLLWFRDGRTRCYDREAGLPTAYVTAVAVDERSQVWAGSSDGWVARVGDERIVALSESTGLPCDAVRGLIADQRGGLWIACDGGVARLPLEDADAFAAGARRDVRAIGWNRQTGMRSEETSATTGPVVATDDEGALWVATIGGLTRVANPAVQPLPAPPRARITRLLLDGVDGLQGATVRAASAGVELSLAALTAIGRRPAWFHRTLSSVDGGLKWDDFDPNPEVRYDSIPAGSYVFEATARDAFGVWDAHVARATFQIKRPLHRMPAVWATFFALAIAAGLFAHRLRVHTMRRQFDAIAAERERIARDLHDGLGQGFTALRFRLEAARRRRSHEPVLSADDVVESLESLVNAVEEESRRAIWNLRARALGGDDVAKGLARLHDEFARSGMLRDARLTVSSSGPCDDVDAMVAAELLQVAREALTNAVRHAKPSEVHVSFDVDDEVRLCVYDDGVGFAYAPSELVAGGHYGILGMRERLRRLGGVLVIDSAFGQGTTVLATVPRRRKGRG